jgi:hypothetical protein
MFSYSEKRVGVLVASDRGVEVADEHGHGLAVKAVAWIAHQA